MMALLKLAAIPVGAETSTKGLVWSALARVAMVSFILQHRLENIMKRNALFTGYGFNFFLCSFRFSSHYCYNYRARRW